MGFKSYWQSLPYITQRNYRLLTHKVFRKNDIFIQKKNTESLYTNRTSGLYLKSLTLTYWNISEEEWSPGFSRWKYCQKNLYMKQMRFHQSACNQVCSKHLYFSNGARNCSLGRKHFITKLDRAVKRIQKTGASQREKKCILSRKGRDGHVWAKSRSMQKGEIKWDIRNKWREQNVKIWGKERSWNNNLKIYWMPF